MAELVLEPEVLITIVAVVLVSIITLLLLRSNAKYRSRIKNDVELIREDPRGAVSSGLLWQVFYGILLFVGFGCWALYLFWKELDWWAISSAAFALLGALIPLNVWMESRQRKNILNQTIQNLDSKKEPLPHKEVEVVAETVPKIKSVTEEVTIKEKPVPVVTYPVINLNDIKVPEDSTLRRHYLTQLRSQISAGFSPRPTDSALRRHHDSMIEASFQEKAGEQIAKFIPAVSDESPIETEKSLKKTISEIVETEPRVDVTQTESTAETISGEIKDVHNEMVYRRRLPEDSMLKRHFLTQLRSEVEARISPRPTDSTLRRHYDTMVRIEIQKLLLY